MQSELRLHPATLLFGLVTPLKNFAVPFLFVAVGASRSNDPGDPARWMRNMPSWMGNGWETWLLLLLVPAVIITLARYLSFRLRYEENEVVIRTGLIFRNERHVPYARIQNVDAIQNVFHRLFQVVEVRLETGGGKEEEARLSVVSRDAFEELRRQVFRKRSPLAAAELDAQAAEAALEDEGRTLLHLPLREVLLCGLLENKGMVLIGAASGALWEFGVGNTVMGRLFADDDSIGRSFFREVVRETLNGGALPVARIGLGVAAFIAFLLIVRIISMVWAFVRLYDFRLTRIGEDLRTTYGLFTRVTTTVPIRRVQTLIVSAGPLQRWLKRASVRVETAGGAGKQDAAASVREWLAPLIMQADVPHLLQQAVPGLDLSNLDWQPLHPRAFRRALKPGLLVTAAVTLGAAFVIGWGAIGVLILMLPWAMVSARQHVKHLAWAESDEVVVMRSGWIWQEVTIARANKIQTVTLHQSPFDRRAAMARVRVDTAGASPVLHRIDIPYLDAGVARALHERLSTHAAHTAFRW